MYFACIVFDIFVWCRLWSDVIVCVSSLMCVILTIWWDVDLLDVMYYEGFSRDVCIVLELCDIQW